MKPYKFHPFLRSMIWGGDKIVRFKGINSSFSSIGESLDFSGESRSRYAGGFICCGNLYSRASGS